MATETKTTEHHEETTRRTSTTPNDHKLAENSHKLSENSKENLDAKLDNAVDETFPGSDPVSVKITK